MRYSLSILCGLLALAFAADAWSQKRRSSRATAEIMAEIDAEEVLEEEEPPAPPPPDPVSLDELLEMVRQGFNTEIAENREREEDFLFRKEDQQRRWMKPLADSLPRKQPASDSKKSTTSMK